MNRGVSSVEQYLYGHETKLCNKTIIEVGFRTIARIIKVSVCLIRLSVRLRQITQTSAVKILAIMLNASRVRVLYKRLAFIPLLEENMNK